MHICGLVVQQQQQKSPLENKKIGSPTSSID